MVFDNDLTVGLYLRKLQLVVVGADPAVPFIEKGGRSINGIGIEFVSLFVRLKIMGEAIKKCSRAIRPADDPLDIIEVEVGLQFLQCEGIDRSFEKYPVMKFSKVVLYDRMRMWSADKLPSGIIGEKGREVG